MPDDPISTLSDRLSQAQSVAEFRSAVAASLADFDELNSQTLATHGTRLDCCAGCSLCCSLRVDVYAHEVFLIAHHIRTRFSEPERAALQTRLAAHSQKVLPMTPYEHATSNHACPLLQADGRCRVYEVRPHSCRRHHSQDVTACQYTYDHPEDLEFPAAHDRELFRLLTVAMAERAEVYAAHGYDTTIYELGSALEEALLDPECEESWRQHLEAFVKASITPRA